MNPDDHYKFCCTLYRRAPAPGDLAIEIGRLFLGAPYRAGTLTIAGPEKLVLNLNSFDCTTFVETILALARVAQAGKWSSAQLRKNLKFIRYRDGKMNGYASRLHYFTDWLSDNQKKKVVKDVSRLLSGTPVRKKINFMTTHRKLYSGLSSELQFNKMIAVEKKLSRKNFYLLDKDEITKRRSAICEGDIIAFATNQDGLDVAHVGFATRQSGHWHLLHASSKEGAVVISKETLVAYLKAQPAWTGILVARIL